MIKWWKIGRKCQLKIKKMMKIEIENVDIRAEKFFRNYWRKTWKYEKKMKEKNVSKIGKEDKN